MKRKPNHNKRHITIKSLDLAFGVKGKWSCKYYHQAWFQSQSLLVKEDFQ